MAWSFNWIVKTLSLQRMRFVASTRSNAVKCLWGRYNTCLCIHAFKGRYAVPIGYPSKMPVSIMPQKPTPSLYLYISSNGLVSLKQLSHTSFTTLAAWTSSLHSGLAISDRVARRRTHSCNCSVILNWFRVKNSRAKRHSPLSIEARI
jgi:hypothetical protein